MTRCEMGANDEPAYVRGRLTVAPPRTQVWRRIISVLGLMLPTLAGAQGTSVVTGRIVDTAGTPIPRASVRVPELGLVAAVDSSGRYRLESVPSGRRKIIGEAPGFTGQLADVTAPASGTVEREFSLVPNAHVLAGVEVRARARRQLPLHLHEFEQRRTRGMGRFLGPDDLVKFHGRPLSDALRTVMAGARFERNAVGELIIVSSRRLNAPLTRPLDDVKPCGIQIWEDGALLSDPNLSLGLLVAGPEPKAGRPQLYASRKLGADHDYDISRLLTNDYAAVEYYADLASTPPGFRSGTPSCGTLMLWTRLPTTANQRQARDQP